ncbi:hypothetical protein GCM10027292_30580 [Hydrogenophaga aquatica]
MLADHAQEAVLEHAAAQVGLELLAHILGQRAVFGLKPNSPDEWELDLKFVNPTDSWMLVEMSTWNDVATCYLYGPELNREVEISQPKISDPIEPDPPKMRVDSKLQKGEKRQVQTAQPGYEVTVTRTVRENGEVILEDTFHSPYQPQQEIWAVGPGTPGAEEAEATGTP